MYPDESKVLYVETKPRIGNVIYDGQEQYIPTLILVASYKGIETFAIKKKPFEDRNMI